MTLEDIGMTETSRRNFLERMAVSTAALAGLSALPGGTEVALAAEPLQQGNEFDQSWFQRLNGTHKAVFDATEIEDGAALLRASIWKVHYGQVLGAKPEELTAVLVIRHHAIALVMTQEFWDRYKIGHTKKVKHPFTEESTTRNPNLLSADKDELPKEFAALNFDGFQKGGGIVLACNLAFRECVQTIAKAEKIEAAEARKRALSMLVTGVILQPSGVFASLRAQEAGCAYLKAS